MRLFKTMIVVSGLAVCSAAGGALASDRGGLVIEAAAKKKSEYQLCLALNKCRNRYTWCFAQLEKKFKPHQWSSERDKCVATYKACIDKTFTGGELFFTRWFERDVDCKRYR